MALDTKTNRNEREAEKARTRAEETPPLDPAWPYVRQYFDPFFFNVQQDAREPAPSPYPEPL